VDHHQCAVPAHVQIQLDSIGMVRQPLAECGERVLRRQTGSAAMGNSEWTMERLHILLDSMHK
jgi:hypothetical protein